jgi:hypothetical protein
MTKDNIVVTDGELVANSVGDLITGQEGIRENSLSCWVQPRGKDPFLPAMTNIPLELGIVINLDASRFKLGWGCLATGTDASTTHLAGLSIATGKGGEMAEGGVSLESASGPPGRGGQIFFDDELGVRSGRIIMREQPGQKEARHR